jgi:hypothetical protein
VVLAAGADVQGLLDDLLEEHVPTLRAAQPEPLRDALAILALADFLVQLERLVRHLGHGG